MSRPRLRNYICLVLYLIAPLKLLHAPAGIQHPTLPGEKRVALTAQLHLQLLLGRAGSKPIATGTNYLGITIILGMNRILHTT